VSYCWKGQPHHWPACLCRRRLRPSRSRDFMNVVKTSARSAGDGTAGSAPLTEPKYIAPLVLITSLFFLWALGVNLNDVLIPHLKEAFSLSDFKSSLIQTAFFGGYFLAALPAGWLMEKIGYKRGILVGLLTCAAGTILFVS